MEFWISLRAGRHVNFGPSQHTSVAAPFTSSNSLLLAILVHTLDMFVELTMATNSRPRRATRRPNFYAPFLSIDSDDSDLEEQEQAQAHVHNSRKRRNDDDDDDLVSLASPGDEDDDEEDEEEDHVIDTSDKEEEQMSK